MTTGAAIAVVAILNTTQAATTDSLADLVNNNGTLTIGDKTFSNFGWRNSDGLLNSQAGNLTVTASFSAGVYYLDWSGNILVNNTGGTSALTGDLVLSYTVAASSGLINMIDQSYTPVATAGSGQIIIGETVKNTSLITVGNSTLTLNPLDTVDPVPEAGDNLNFSPGEPQLFVTKDILINASAGASVGLSEVQQSFHQIPEPGAALLLLLGSSTLWVLRKHKAA